MANKKSKTSSNRLIASTLLVAVLGVAVFAAYVKMTPAASHVPEDLRRPDQVSQQVPVGHADTKPDHKDQTLLIPTVDGTEVKLGKTAPAVPEGQDPRVFLLTETFHSFGIADGRAVGIELLNKNAIVDVNDAIQSHGYGSMEEGQLIKAIGLALTQFPDISTFQLRNGGQIVDSLGHFEMTDPIPLIQKGEPDSPTKPDAG